MIADIRAILQIIREPTLMTLSSGESSVSQKGFNILLPVKSRQEQNILSFLYTSTWQLEIRVIYVISQEHLKY